MHFQLPLLGVYRQFFLPEAFDFAFVFLLAHASSLCVHLLDALVFCKLLHELGLEFVFHAFFFGCTLRL